LGVGLRDTMTGMKSHGLRIVGLILCVLALGAARSVSAQTGSIDFTAQLTPANGNAEPVRGLPFFLLTKSFEDIRKDVEAAHPMPDANKYIDGLNVSNEMKAWLKKHDTVSLTGDEFVHKLNSDDVMDVPEFLDAYLKNNLVNDNEDFPKAKYKDKDKTKNPEKYKAQKQEYLDALRKFIKAHPESLVGMDSDLNSINPGPAWDAMIAKREPVIRRETMELARKKYIAAQAETDLQGHGSISGVRPGTYWLGTLDIYATVGDARVQWDAPVEVRPGAVTRLRLDNANAAEPVAANR
jgi:hypothetical protein